MSPQYPDFIWLKNVSSKILPFSKGIQHKIEEFNKKMNLANLYYSPETKKTTRSTFQKFYKEKLSQEKNGKQNNDNPDE